MVIFNSIINNYIFLLTTNVPSISVTIAGFFKYATCQFFKLFLCQRTLIAVHIPTQVRKYLSQLQKNLAVEYKPMTTINDKFYIGATTLYAQIITLNTEGTESLCFNILRRWRTSKHSSSVSPATSYCGCRVNSFILAVENLKTHLNWLLLKKQVVLEAKKKIITIFRKNLKYVISFITQS